MLSHSEMVNGNHVHMRREMIQHFTVYCLNHSFDTLNYPELFLDEYLSFWGRLTKKKKILSGCNFLDKNSVWCGAHHHLRVFVVKDLATLNTSC